MSICIFVCADTVFEWSLRESYNLVHIFHCQYHKLKSRHYACNGNASNPKIHQWNYMPFAFLFFLQWYRYIHILPHSLPFVAMQLEFIWEKLWYICLIVFFKYVRTKSWNTKDYDVNRRTLMKIRKTANALLYSQFFYDNFSKQKKNFEFLWFFSLA